MRQLKSLLENPVSGIRLSIFRIVFGLFMIYEILDYIKIKLVDVGLLQPKLNFAYSPFNFGPLPSPIFKVVILLMLFAAILITIGFQTKKSALYFSISYMYIILLEKAYFNNHLYLFALIALIFSIVNSEEHFSLKQYLSKDKPAWIPRWHLLALQVQIVMVYFFGGVAKLGKDWFTHLEPIKSMSENIPDDVWYSFIKSESGLKFFIFGGLFIDLLLSLCLFHKKLKWLAIPAIIIFNFMNTRIFNDIGIFPYLMLGVLVLFINGNEVLKFFPSMNSIVPLERTTPKPTTALLGWTMAIFFAFQWIMPFRGHFFSQNMDWTGIHQSFSWRMKSMSRELVDMKWVVINGETKESIPIEHGKYINNMQIDAVARNAQAVLDFARFVKSEATKRKIPKPEVRAQIIVKFNGREQQEFVKSDIDLASDEYNLSNTKRWLVPLKDY